MNRWILIALAALLIAGFFLGDATLSFNELDGLLGRGDAQG